MPATIPNLKLSVGEDYADPAYPEGLYVNVDGTVKVDGFEAAAVARLADGLTLDASYTYARSRDAGSLSSGHAARRHERGGCRNATLG